MNEVVVVTGISVVVIITTDDVPIFKEVVDEEVDGVDVVVVWMEVVNPWTDVVADGPNNSSEQPENIKINIIVRKKKIYFFIISSLFFKSPSIYI